MSRKREKTDSMYKGAARAEPRARRTMTLPPNLSNLRVAPRNGAHRAHPADVGVVLERWSDLEERLSAEQLERLPEVTNDRNAECAICYDRLAESVGPGPDGRKVVVAVDDPVLSCGHAFHLECALRWFDAQRDRGERVLKCPSCRQPFEDAFFKERYATRDARDSRPQRPPTNRQRSRPTYPRLEPGNFMTLDGRPGRGYHVPLIPTGTMHSSGVQRGTLLYYGLLVDYHLLVPDALGREGERFTADAYTEYTHRLFMDAIGGGDTPTYEQWKDWLVLSEFEWVRTATCGYWILRAVWRGRATFAAQVYRMAREAVRNVVHDVREARAEGSSWASIFRALVYGDERDGA